jgi:hypothetical protein
MPNTSSSTVVGTNGTGQEAVPAPTKSQLERLRAPFEIYFTDTRGGVEIAFVDGWQVTDRLLEVVGAFGFRVLRDGINVEADEAWALGQLTAEVDGRTVTIEQFGGQKIHRSAAVCRECGLKANSYHDRNLKEQGRAAHRADTDGPGEPLAIADDMKGAGTDAFKKCASLLGVGLYLSRKDGTPIPGRAMAATRGEGRRAAPAQAAQGQRPAPAAPNRAPAKTAAQTATTGLRCTELERVGDPQSQCPNNLEPVEFSDGTKWSVGDLANFTHKEFQQPLCYPHAKVRVEAKRAAQAAVTGAGQKAASG